MARKKSPTLLPDTSCLQLVRLEADEQSLIAIVETTSSEALVRFANVVPRVSIRVTPAWWQIYPGRVGRCGSNCMYDAFSAGIRNVKAGSLPNGCPLWWLPMLDAPRVCVICSR